MYTGNREILVDYNVTVRSTKIAVGGTGLITFREGYGVMSPQEWEPVFEELAGS